MSALLISVRDAAEARLALDAGAGLIDVKEPARGPLGRADDAVLTAVLEAVAGRRPVSAALGELSDGAALPAGLGGLAFVKWGLAGAAADWPERLATLRRQVEAASACAVVVAAYADHRRAGAPAPREVCHQAVAAGHRAVLLDTFAKDGTTLLDWLSLTELAELVLACRAGGVRVALAGGLGPRHIEALLHLRPDWFAVRGSACAGGARGGTLDGGRVRALADLVSRARPAG
jgi:uncharacterized protein (UPF0264 family)